MLDRGAASLSVYLLYTAARVSGWYGAAHYSHWRICWLYFSMQAYAACSNEHLPCYSAPVGMFILSLYL